jgi:TonB family protein
MFFPKVLLAALAAAALGSSALAAEAPGAPRSDDAQSDDSDALPVEGVITNPDWVQLPSADELAEYYPPMASAMGVEGRVVMQCKVTSLGAVESCRIVQQTPMGIGFGAAALMMAPSFRMKPMSLNGVPVSGAAVTIPIHFALPEVAAAEADALNFTGQGPAPNAQAMELGRRLVAAVDFTGRASRTQESAIEGLMAADQQTEAADVAARDAARTALQQAWKGALDAQARWLAEAYARSFTQAELEQIVAFMEGPAGKAWNSHQVDIDDLIRKSGPVFGRQAAAEATRVFCQKVACPGAAAPPAAPASKPTPPHATK